MEDDTVTKVTNNKDGGNKPKTIIIASLIVLLIIIIAIWIYLFVIKDSNNKENIDGEVSNSDSYYQLNNNNLDDFDLYFMQLENNNENMIYSPLSIKYALAMLSDGANGATKEQIDNIIGGYTPRSYNNSENMSFANGLFVKDTYEDSINNSYVNLVASKYNAEVIIDSFASASTLNNWISDKTFGLITNITDDVSHLDFMLVNALAIDMEWIEKIQSENVDYNVEFPH